MVEVQPSRILEGRFVTPPLSEGQPGSDRLDARTGGIRHGVSGPEPHQFSHFYADRIHRHQHRLALHLCAARRWVSRLLRAGPQTPERRRPRASGSPPSAAAMGTHAPCAPTAPPSAGGMTTTAGRLLLRTKGSPPSAAAPSTPAACAPMALPSAGVVTTTARRLLLRTKGSPPSAAELRTPAHCAPMALPSAGGETTLARLPRPRARVSPPSASAVAAHLRTAHRWLSRLLGAKRLWPGFPAHGREFHRHQHRQSAHLRTAHRWLSTSAGDWIWPARRHRRPARGSSPSAAEIRTPVPSAPMARMPAGGLTTTVRRRRLSASRCASPQHGAAALSARARNSWHY